MHALLARSYRRAAQTSCYSTGVQGMAHLRRAQEMLDQTPMDLYQARHSLSIVLCPCTTYSMSKILLCRCQVPDEAYLRLRHCHKGPLCTVNSQCCAVLCQRRSKRLACLSVCPGGIMLCSRHSPFCQNDAIILTLCGKLCIHTYLLMPFTWISSLFMHNLNGLG